MRIESLPYPEFMGYRLKPKSRKRAKLSPKKYCKHCDRMQDRNYFRGVNHRTCNGCWLKKEWKVCKKCGGLGHRTDDFYKGAKVCISCDWQLRSSWVKESPKQIAQCRCQCGRLHLKPKFQELIIDNKLWCKH